MERTLGGLELERLIETCAKCGVESFEYSRGKVNVKFVNATKVVDKLKVETVPQNNDEAPGPVISVELSESQRKQIARIQYDEWIENLKISNPLLYEDMLARGELKDVQDEQDNRGLESSL